MRNIQRLVSPKVIILVTYMIVLGQIGEALFTCDIFFLLLSIATVLTFHVFFFATDFPRHLKWPFKSPAKIELTQLIQLRIPFWLSGMAISVLCIVIGLAWH